MPTLRPLPSSQDEAAVPNPEATTLRVKGQVADPQKFAVEVKPSAIDGQGVFALKAIPARRKIGEVRGEAVSTAEAFKRARAADKSTGRVFMIALSHARAMDLTHATDLLRFANHSCAPNMVLKVHQGRVAFHALRDIAVGEELTVAYGPTHHAGRLTCRCGAPGCSGTL